MTEMGKDALNQRRQTLLQTVTNADFRHWADEFWINFSEILHTEIMMTRTHPQLFVLPENAVADFPGFDAPTIAEVRKEWTEVRRKYQNPHRHLDIIAYSTANPRNHLFFISTPHKLSRAEWMSQMISLDGVHLPLTVDNRGGETPPRFIPKPDLDTPITNLVVALVSIYDPESVADAQKTAKTRKIVEGQNQMFKTDENLALNLLLNQPQKFIDYFNPRIMRALPNRLMTDTEVQQWIQMVQQVMKKGAVNVGLPGTFGYCRYESIFQFGLGLALKSTYLDTEGKDLNNTLSVPVSIRNGNSSLGWMIISSHYFPSLGQINVQFHHGADQVFWYDLLKK